MHDLRIPLFDTTSSVAESEETRSTVRGFLDVLIARGYRLTPPVNVIEGDDTVHFVNASSTPFKQTMADQEPVGRTCQYQPCFRAHGERPWLFAFGMAGLVADLEGDAALDEVAVDSHLATLSGVPDHRPDRLHVLIDARDDDLIASVTAAADGHGGTVHVVEEPQVSTRWEYGEGYPQRGRGITYYYRRPAVGCDEECRPDCRCERWQPLSNLIVVESGSRRYAEVGFGVEITAAIPHGSNAFALPEIDQRVRAAERAGLAPGAAADAVNLFRAVALLEESGVVAAAKGAGSVARRFQGRLLDVLRPAEDRDLLLATWGASPSLHAHLAAEDDRRGQVRERNLRAATRTLERSPWTSDAQLRTTYGLDEAQLRSLRPRHHRPSRLSPGAAAVVVSPSWQGGDVFPERAQRGISDLASWSGLTVSTAPVPPGSSPGSRQARAAQLNQALGDPEVDAVMWMIGGVTAAQLLDLVDYEAFATSPKVLCGYSDATVLHHGLYARTGVVTFYGPAVLSEFAETGGTPELTRESFLDVVMRGWTGTFPRSRDVYDEFVEWGGSDRARVAEPALPRNPLRPGTGSGPLLAGCLQSALQLVGTPWLPDYRSHVLALEFADDGSYGPSQAARDLWHLRQAGLLDGIEGLIIGRPRLWSREDRASLGSILLGVCADTSFPILTEFEFGHTDPVVTLPVGSPVQLSGDELTLLEPAVR